MCINTFLLIKTKIKQTMENLILKNEKKIAIFVIATTLAICILIIIKWLAGLSYALN